MMKFIFKYLLLTLFFTGHSVVSAQKATDNTDTIIDLISIKKRIEILRKTEYSYVTKHTNLRHSRTPEPKYKNYIHLSGKLKKIPFLTNNTDTRLLFSFFKELFFNNSEGLSRVFTLYNYSKEIMGSDFPKDSLPAYLMLMPAVLTGFDHRYTSPEGHGMWRLSYPVAVKYGVRIDSTVDFRYSMITSTRVAFKYINDLNRLYGSLDAAILAYLTSPVILKNAVQDAGSFEEILQRMPPEARLDFHFFKALVLVYYLEDELGIVSENEFHLPPKDTLISRRSIHIPSMIRILKADSANFYFLNPVRKGNRIDSAEVFYLPSGFSTLFEANSDSLYRLSDSIFRPAPADAGPKSNGKQGGPVYHTVRRGETLSQIVRKYPGASVAEVVRLNKLRSPDKIHEGQRLIIFR